MTIRIEKPEFLFREKLNAVDSNIPVSKMPNGSVIQVATRHKQGGTYVNVNQSTYVDVTGLSVPITPKHHGSMIMIIVNLNSIYLQHKVSDFHIDAKKGVIMIDDGVEVEPVIETFDLYGER